MPRTIIAGIDEAGYGPLLGPLVVSAAAFFVPAPLPAEGVAAPCLWKLLPGAVTRRVPPTRGRLVIADSKKIHPLTGGDKHLERAVLAMLAVLEHLPAVETAWDLLRALQCPTDTLHAHPWYAADCLRYPWLCSAADIAIAANMLRGACARSGVAPACLYTRLVPESSYNALVRDTRNKHALLVSITLAHASRIGEGFPEDDILFIIDKQGGRDHYTDLLLRFFPEAALKVLEEGAGRSRYMLSERSRRMVLHFQEKGESRSLPTALASMTCKYLRELFMAGFNQWWCQRVAGLRPTAGYYLDGQRWINDVRPHLERLGVAHGQLVRER